MPQKKKVVAKRKWTRRTPVMNINNQMIFTVDFRYSDKDSDHLDNIDIRAVMTAVGEEWMDERLLTTLRSIAVLYHMSSITINKQVYITSSFKFKSNLVDYLVDLFKTNPRVLVYPLQEFQMIKKELIREGKE